MIQRSLLLVVLLAGGCAQATGKYPSLALRPIESRSDAEVVTPAPPVTPDAGLDAQLATVTANLARTDADFAKAAARADAAARTRGATTAGSDAWLAAQTALADLESLRGDTQGAVGDLERMVTGRGDAGQPPYPALDALRARAQDQADAEGATVDAVKALLGGGN